jgi:hypothetical protein
VGDHQHDPLAAQVAGQEGQQVPGRAVGPVHVLDHHDQGVPVGQGAEQAEQELEQPALVGRLRRRHRAGMTQVAQGRQEPGQLRPGRPGERPHPLHPDLADQVAQGLDGRCEGQLAVGEGDAAADQHPRAGPGLPGGELAGQARLADAGLAPQEDHHRRAAVRPPQGRVEHGKLPRPTDEGWAGHLAAHLAGIIAPAPLDENRGSTGYGPKDRDLAGPRSMAPAGFADPGAGRTLQLDG